MKYIIKCLFVIVLSLHYAVPANASGSCDEIKKDIKTLKVNPGHYYFRIGLLCEFELINDKRRFDIAVESFTKSSKHNYVPSYIALGILYKHKFENGSKWIGSKGETEDLFRSIEYFKKAAESQSATAENALGEIYLHGANLFEESRPRNDFDNISGVSEILPNLDKAIYWLEQAAKHGHPAAQGTLSDLYLRGIGLPQDFVMAYVWQSLSVASQFRYNKMMQNNDMGKYLVKNQGLIAEEQYKKLTEMQKKRSTSSFKRIFKTLL